jgi:hypothetical protein
MRRMLNITMLSAVTFAVLVPNMSSQRIVVSPSHFASGFNRPHHLRTSFYPLGFSDPFYSDYLAATGYPVASQPPVIVMQAPSPAVPTTERFPLPAEPLMIELQGDRYVQVSSSQTSLAEMTPQEQEKEKEKEQEKEKARQKNRVHPTSDSPIRSDRPSNAAIHAVIAPDLPAAVLVFRDGHNEEVSDFTIADGVLYTRGDPYAGGSWNRKIGLSALNLPETIATNNSRGVKFQLPSSPNEVIVRP